MINPYKKCENCVHCYRKHVQIEGSEGYVMKCDLYDCQCGRYEKEFGCNRFIDAVERLL